jgi:hypothetical protein
MGVIMTQQRREVEAREREHALCCEEMAVQRNESHEARESKLALCHEKMAMQCKDSHAQHQMMRVMLITMMKKNSALSGMMSNVGGIGAFLMGNPPQNDNSHQKCKAR